MAALMYDTLMKGYQKSWNITEELKATDQMRWVGLMNNIHACAEEIVMKNYIYN